MDANRRIFDEYSVNKRAAAANVGTGHTWENQLLGEAGEDQKNQVGRLDNRY